ncbi:CD276 antigen-like [Plectropomus leopardus]|uniref:CD276 antigen-like n=1 Tax=Plectropomus leopardus TaxID=160734 RepID=UPI001C4C7FBB|nr:CD276 antigen-like [Plectropomus leopardus]
MVNPDIKTATLRPRLNPLTFLFLLCFTGKTDQNGSAVITVREDSDVVLPCSLATRENIELKLFDWIKRATENDGQNEVFYYDGGIHYNSGRSGQSEQFKGRVSHFPEKLKHGNASIIIRNTKVTDSGNYTCVFPRLQPRQTFHTELVVERELRDRTTENILGESWFR